MPTLHAHVVYALNGKFRPARVGQLREMALGLDMNATEAPSLRTLIEGIDGPVPPEAAEFIDSMPSSMAYGVAAICRHAVLASKGVVFTWKAGYDWNLDISDTPDTASTPGGVRIEITSRYPNDPHPLASGSQTGS